MSQLFSKHKARCLQPTLQVLADACQVFICGELGSWWSNEGTIETPPLLNYQRSNEDWW